MKRILFLTLLVLLLSGCNKQDLIKINGYYPGNTGDYLYLNRIDVDQSVFIDSVKIKGSGNFSVKFNYMQPAFYNIGFNNTEFVTLIAYPGDRIAMNFKGEKLQNDYTVGGSPESENIRLLDIKLNETLATLDSLSEEYQNASSLENFETIQPVLEEAYLTAVKNQRMHNIAFIIENLSSFASIKALYQRIDESTYVLYQPRDAQYLKLVSDSLGALYPNSKQVISLASNLDRELKEMYLESLTSAVNDVKPVILDADLPDLNGKKIKLSDLRGTNYVLLSFWSAQSKECITNNLQMKTFYARYHREGFEIYQVNLDTDEKLWKTAIKYDELPWISVREEDPAQPVTARKFNITKVPANYLLDKNGEIIGKDLFGRSLQIKLSQLFE